MIGKRVGETWVRKTNITSDFAKALVDYITREGVIKGVQ
jgi:hypothetical protein